MGHRRQINSITHRICWYIWENKKSHRNSRKLTHTVNIEIENIPSTPITQNSSSPRPGRSPCHVIPQDIEKSPRVEKFIRRNIIPYNNNMSRPHLIPTDETVPLRVPVSRYKSRPIANTFNDPNAPRYTLVDSIIMVMKANSVTKQDTRHEQEYRDLVKVKDKLI